MVDLNRRALIMVKPDGVVQRITGELLGWLALRGLRPLAFREVVLTAERRRSLYATTRTGGRLDWDLNAILYTLGPVHAVLLEGDHPAGFDSLSDFVSRALKGHFVPGRARPGTMRGALGALNPVFNLVHATDSTDDLERETMALFDETLCHVAVPREVPLPDAVRATPARRTPLWTTVAGVVEPWIGKANWPDDRAGPSVPALLEARNAWDAALERLPDAGESLKGIRTGATPYGSLVERPEWASYLTYTTLRYLDLCLEGAAPG
ncbi:hypothetical protein Sru01_42060 [Sphaerisporangium rufum]|uniref:Nucleoside diphosphate kinase-like domain-containing protein n=1 Tax=Sphaerisporangium rufum TaxID=1381558 RepID=A0A919R3W4_9ACTN|nr:nucleoside-diphosphate kinase [Sphaerisporangium rufum]GII79224.1 hypothetical protein Sru01_42060 [Sphaerisporangium rufum]